MAASTRPSPQAFGRMLLRGVAGREADISDETLAIVAQLAADLLRHPDAEPVPRAERPQLSLVR